MRTTRLKKTNKRVLQVFHATTKIYVRAAAPQDVKAELWHCDFFVRLLKQSGHPLLVTYGLIHK